MILALKKRTTWKVFSSKFSDVPQKLPFFHESSERLLPYFNFPISNTFLWWKVRIIIWFSLNRKKMRLWNRIQVLEQKTVVSIICSCKVGLPISPPVIYYPSSLGSIKFCSIKVCIFLSIIEFSIWTCQWFSNFRYMKIATKEWIIYCYLYSGKPQVALRLATSTITM